MCIHVHDTDVCIHAGRKRVQSGTYTACYRIPLLQSGIVNTDRAFENLFAEGRN
jgi:hypothetical protein